MHRQSLVAGLQAVAALLALPLTSACTAPQSAERAVAGDGPSAVRAALDTSVAAWNRGDLDAHVLVYADTARLLPGAPGRGRAQARRTLEPFFAVPAERPQLALDSLRVAPLGPGHVLATGQYVLQGGTVVGPRRGWFTEVWGRTPAGWRIIHDHSS